METIITTLEYIKRKNPDLSYSNNLLLNSDLKPYINPNFDIDLFFKGENLKKVLKKISSFSVKNQNIILEQHRKDLVSMMEAVDNLNIEFLENRFIGYYLDDYILTAEKINHDIQIFKHAFAKNPQKFIETNDLIPINFVRNIKIVADSKLICHTLSNCVNICTIDIAHEILMAKIISSKLKLKLLVTLNQQDSEIENVLSHFSTKNKKYKKTVNLVMLNEKNSSIDFWDLKKKCFELKISQDLNTIGSKVESIKKMFF